MYILWHDAWKPVYFIARQQLGKHILAEANANNNRRAVFSVIRSALVATQLCGKYTSEAVNKHATTQEAVFSVGAAPRLRSQLDLTRLELEMSGVP
jgi:hypothetical protein